MPRIWLIVSLLAACVPSRGGVIDRDAPSPGDARAHADAVAEAEAAWAERADPAKLDAAMRAWERAVALDPTDWQSRIALARAAHFVAYGPMRDRGDRAGAIEALERGMEHARRGMAAYAPEVERRLATGVPIEEVATLVDARGIGLVFWYATTLGSWVSHKGTRAGMENKDRLLSLIQHVHQTDPAYFYGAADRFLGAYYAALPAFVGGDLERSRGHFDASLAAAPNFLGTYLLLAELYAPRADDPALFDRSIAQVLDAKPCAETDATPCILPELGPEAAIDKRRARELEKKKASLF